jgi:hypothetical protein
MKAVDHQSNIPAVDLQHDFVGQLESLDAAIFLAQELKGERYAMPFSDRSQLSST